MTVHKSFFVRQTDKDKKKRHYAINTHTHTYLCCSSAHISHHPARHTRLKDVGGGKVIHFLQRHLTQGQVGKKSNDSHVTECAVFRIKMSTFT